MVGRSFDLSISIVVYIQFTLLVIFTISIGHIHYLYWSYPLSLLVISTIPIGRIHHPYWSYPPSLLVVSTISIHLSWFNLLALQALYRQKKFESALKVLNQAIRINKSNHIPKFHKALVLESLGRPQVCRGEGVGWSLGGCGLVTGRVWGVTGRVWVGHWEVWGGHWEGVGWSLGGCGVVTGRVWGVTGRVWGGHWEGVGWSLRGCGVVTRRVWGGH